jgi:hypothetical protein
LVILVHVLLGLAIYPLAWFLFVLDKRIAPGNYTMDFDSNGKISRRCKTRLFLRESLWKWTYYPALVVVVIGWFVFGYLVADYLGLPLMIEDEDDVYPRGISDLLWVYRLGWAVFVCWLVSRAHKNAAKRF